MISLYNKKPAYLTPTMHAKLHIPVTSPAQEESGLSRLTHEVRNPLTNITLAVELLNGMITDENQLKYLEIISRGANRINGLINELTRSQQESEHPTGETSLFALLDEVINMAEDRIKLKDIRVMKRYSLRDYKKIANRADIKIALTNIIINAIDAMSPGEGILRIMTKSTGQSYIVRIEDNGSGIKAEHMEQIFSPFFTTKSEGLGIGLSASAEIFKDNGVSVKVKSREKRGTQFILEFENS